MNTASPPAPSLRFAAMRRGRWAGAALRRQRAARPAVAKGFPLAPDALAVLAQAWQVMVWAC